MESGKVPSASRSLAHLKPVTFSGVRMIRPPRDAYGETEACVVCPYLRKSSSNKQQSQDVDHLS